MTTDRKPGFWNRPGTLVLALVLTAVAAYLWFEHSIHLAGVLPLLLPLAICVGMHFFMHGGHGHNRNDE